MAINLGQQFTQGHNQAASDFLIKTVGTDDLTSLSTSELARAIDAANQANITGLSNWAYSGTQISGGIESALSDYENQIKSKGVIADAGRDTFRMTFTPVLLQEANRRINEGKTEARAGMTAMTKDGKIIYYDLTRPNLKTEFDRMISGEGWTNQGITTPKREYKNPALAPEGSEQARVDAQGGSTGTGWYDQVTGKDTPVGVGTPRPTSTTTDSQTTSTANQPADKDIKTARKDVVATFHKYLGRNPTSTEDWNNVYNLMTKAPTEVESRLSAISDKIKTDATTARTDSTGGTTDATSNIDPLKVAQNLGYTAADFANDPGFTSYWGNKSKAELEEALKNRNDYDSTSGRKRTPSEQGSYDESSGWLQDLLDTGEIDQAQFNALDGIMNTDDYTSGKRVYTEAEMTKIAIDAESKARTDLEPYYTDLKSRDMEDLKTGYEDINNSAARYTQNEQKSYKETLAATKQGLRAKGLTFSGQSRGTLGKEGALADKGVEGSVPQNRRYSIEDNLAGFQQQARDLGTTAERRYGSAALTGQAGYLEPGTLPDPYSSGLDYNTSSTRSLYDPKKDASQRGYVSPEQSDIARERELEVQKRKQDRLNTYKY